MRPGVWEIVFSAGADVVTGKRRQIRRRVHGTKREALDRLAELRRDHSGGRHHDISLGE